MNSSSEPLFRGVRVSNSLRHFCRASFVFLLLTGVLIAQSARQPLITKPINENVLVTLKGNTHPLAQRRYDMGIAPPDLPMNRMLLVLNHDPQQDFALRKLLDDQQDKNSPSYHQWMTPAQFGAQFGATDQDIQLVTGWLQTHGFQIDRVSNGRSVIEFSGVESQVEQAFHTQIHRYVLPNGEQHWANASDPKIPAALAPAVAGVASLNNFPPSHFSHVAGVISRDKATGQETPSSPLFTLNGNCGVPQVPYCYGVGPYDFATIYDVAPSWTAVPPIDGTGQTIAIVGETDINPQDVDDFRNFFGLPAYGQQGGPSLNVIHSGPAPGILNDGEETEADLDVEWSGAVAKGASVDFVVSQTTETSLGVNLSALYIVDNNLAPVMSESYGYCELFLGTTGNQFFSSLWQQAAAQGITVMVSAGDGGSAGCDNFDVSGPATHGLQVSGFASTPYNVAVGGTDFNDLTSATSYWSSTNNATTRASALKYIPETTWDDNCTNPVFGTLLGFSTNAETNCNNPQIVNAGFVNIVSGSGGKSSCINSDGQNASSCTGGYSKPSWQTAPGVPSDGVRDLPDISLYAASGSPSGSFYVVCEADAVGGSSCDPNNPSTQFLGVGGTSASSPAFAGIMALVNQKTGARQGNANFVLYKLAQQHPFSFHDVTTGTIAVPCLTGTLNCNTSRSGDQYGILSGYNAGTGYDLATGIGSVDVGNLLSNWSLATFRASTTTLTLTPTSNLTHGQSVAVTGTVVPSSGSGTPTGSVSLMTSTGVSAGTLTLSNGAISGNTILLPGGTGYTVTAHYAGDATFGGSDSTPVTVTVGKENSSAQAQLVTFDWQGNLISANATSAVYGSPYLLRVDILNSAGVACDNGSGLAQFGCPTGTISLTDNGSPLSGTFALNSLGYTEDQAIQLPGGTNSLQAQYPGDNSFNASSTTATLNITPAPTNMPPLGVCCVSVGQEFSTYAIVQAKSSGAAPTGTVSFFANGKPITGTVSYSQTPGSASYPSATLTAFFSTSTSPFSAPGNYTITANYSGDANYQATSAAAAPLYVKFPAPTMTVQANPNPVNAGSSTKLVATVLGASKTIAPTGTISFSGSSSGALSGTVSYVTVTDPSTGNLDLQGTLTITPAFTDTYSASYGGDTNYLAAYYFGTVVTVNGNDFVFTANQNSATVSSGFSASYQLFIGMQSSTAPVSFACSGLPNEATCNFLPNPIPYSGVVYVSISTTAPTRAAATRASIHTSPHLWWSSMFPFAAILLIGYRRGGTKRSLSRLLLSFLLLFGIACGGGGSNGGGGDVTPPPPPANLTATSASTSQINLNWSASAGATAYAVYRSTITGLMPSPSDQIASGLNGTSYSDTGLSSYTTYYYVVTAANSSASSGPSNQASATTQATDPGTPPGTYNVTVTGTSGSISHSVNLTLVVQ